MKTTLIKMFGLFLVLFIAQSCEDILEEQTFTEISTNTFYQNQADALAALNAAYAKLKEGNGYYKQIFLSNLFAASDQGLSSFQHGAFRSGNIESTNPNLPRTWIEIYDAIKDANNVIANVNETNVPDADIRMRILGEARFLRGLHYFNLVRCFGEVPLRTTPVLPNDEGLPLSPITDIYDVIISDFQYAADHCWAFNESRNGLTNNIGRVTKASAHAMLAKVYIQMASSKRTALEGVMGNARYAALPGSADSYYQLAKEQCDLVLTQSFYQLVTDLDSWINIFSSTNGNNAEMLFDVQGSAVPGQGTAVSNLFSPQNSGLAGGGFGGVNRMIPGFINNNMDRNDARYQNSIVRAYQDATNSYALNLNSNGYFRTNLETGEARGILQVIWTAKYIDRDATTEYTSQQNWHVIRLADVYLMRAEALAELNRNPSLANPDLSILRNRVGMPNFDGSAMDMTQFRRALLRERSAELSAEGHRFFDITRMGVYDELCRAAHGPTVGARGIEDYTWPVPLIETSSNPNIGN